jgi:hypothetical protein
VAENLRDYVVEESRNINETSFDTKIVEVPRGR